MPYNAAYIGFVYTSLGLKGHHNGWWEREGQRLGSWLHLQTGDRERELSFKRRHEVSRLSSQFCMLPMGGQDNNCAGIRGRCMLLSRQTHAETADGTGLVDHINPTAAA